MSWGVAMGLGTWAVHRNRWSKTAPGSYMHLDSACGRAVGSGYSKHTQLMGGLLSRMHAWYRILDELHDGTPMQVRWSGLLPSLLPSR